MEKKIKGKIIDSNVINTNSNSMNGNYNFVCDILYKIGNEEKEISVDGIYTKLLDFNYEKKYIGKDVTIYIYNNMNYIDLGFYKDN